MKLFDVPWLDVLTQLPRWNALPLDARRVLLSELHMNGYIVGSTFGAHRDVIAASGIAHFDAERNRFSLTNQHRPFVKVLRAASRIRMFDNPSLPILIGYLEEHFTQVDIESLSGRHTGGFFGVATRAGLAARVAYPDWPGDLLAATTDARLQSWATARGVTAASDVTLLRIRALRDLLELLRRHADGLPLRELIARYKQFELPALAETIHLGLATVVLFVGMRGHDLDLMIGLWPEAAHELDRPPTERPHVVTPSETFTLAVRMEDMTAVLAAISAAPVRVRTDDLSVFARTRVAIEAQLVAVPSWVTPVAFSPLLTRVDAAARELTDRDMVELHELQGHPHLVRTASGAAWLALSSAHRLRALIEPLRQSPEINPPSQFEPFVRVGFFSFELPYFQVPDQLRMRDAITRTWLDRPDDFVSLESILEYATREANPFTKLSGLALRDLQHMMHFGGGEPRAQYNALWRNALTRFLIDRLVAFGGAELGRLGADDIAVRLTGVGRYLLGAAEDFEYGSADIADVVVQPNFDIVFLGVAPSVEASLARLADRVGRAPGLVFRITRASVLRAAESGLSADDLIAALTAASSKPLPTNVRREIAGWLATVRRVTLRAIEVITCDGSASADRVAELLGNKVLRLSETLFEMPAATPAARAALLKKLRAAGVFLDDQSGTGARPKRGRR